MGLFDRILKRTPEPPEEVAGKSTALRRHGTPVDRTDIERLVGHTIKDTALFEQALRHRSLMRGDNDAHLDSNERLEYLGDAVLGFVVAEFLFQSFPDEAEGWLTRLRAKLVSGQSLAASARTIHLDRYLQTSDSVSNEHVKASDSMLSDAFEAILGALYMDLGMDATRTFIEKHLLDRPDLRDLAAKRHNHKSALLEFLQARGRPQPVYRVMTEVGPSHDKVFEVAVFVEEEECGRAAERSKKRAEQDAASQALARLRARDPE